MSSTKIVETEHGYIEMPSHYDPEQITEADLANDPAMRLVREEDLGLTAVCIERDDDFGGEFETDDDFERFVEVYDAAEAEAIHGMFGNAVDVTVTVHRNTSGYPQRISWRENGAVEVDDGSSRYGDAVREAQRIALENTWHVLSDDVPESDCECSDLDVCSNCGASVTEQEWAAGGLRCGAACRPSDVLREEIEDGLDPHGFAAAVLRVREHDAR